MGSRGWDDHVMRSEAEFLRFGFLGWVEYDRSNNTWISQWALFWVGFGSIEVWVTAMGTVEVVFFRFGVKN